MAHAMVVINYFQPPTKMMNVCLTAEDMQAMQPIVNFLVACAKAQQSLEQAMSDLDSNQRAARARLSCWFQEAQAILKAAQSEITRKLDTECEAVQLGLHDLLLSVKASRKYAQEREQACIALRAVCSF